VAQSGRVIFVVFFANAKVDQTFPALGDGFLSLAIAVVGLNEAIGPVLFKIALSREPASCRTR
jgi:hypothetical protein